jgi:hypothetical protein
VPARGVPSRRTGRIREDDHRKFESLCLVDGGYPDAFRPFLDYWRLVGLTALSISLYLLDECTER